MPAFSPAPGGYTTPQSVTLYDATPGSTIYYTLDGSTPSAASNLYGEAIIVSTTTTINAIAIANGYNQSNAAGGTYTITPPNYPANIATIAGKYQSTTGQTIPRRRRLRSLRVA